MGKMLYDISEYDSEASLDLLGGKGYHLMQLKKLGVNVPPAFVLPTSLCKMYQDDPANTMEMVESELLTPILDGLTKHFGYLPLVSVRSGAKVSMPGMMDTILNVGLDNTTYAEWQDRLGHDCALNSMERLVEMFGSVVHGIDRKYFEGKSLKDRLKVFQGNTDEEFPSAKDQILESIEAVFDSWNNERAILYRDTHGIPHDMGTAVVVQAMVFGNMNDKSCTGVLFTRNPSTGENKVTGEFLINAQGEDVVAGTSTPKNLNEMVEWNPTIAQEVLDVAEKLEDHYRDMQDIEFTVQDGELFVLQTRSAKRTALAAIKVAVDLQKEGKVTKAHAIKRVTMKQYLAAIRPKISDTFDTAPHTTGIPASNGVVTGIAVFSSESAVNCKKPCILIAEETTPDDLKGMIASKGILTSKGGATSHAAVVARGMDKVCVVGASDITILPNKKEAVISNPSLSQEIYISEGDQVTIDGETGRVWFHMAVPVVDGSKVPEVQNLKKMIEDEYPYLKVVTSEKDFKKGDMVYILKYLLTSTDQLLSIMDKAGGGVIDLITPKYVEDEDRVVYEMFGDDAESIEDADFIAAMNQWKGDMTKFSVLTTLKGMLDIAYNRVAIIDSLESYVLATAGYVVFSKIPESSKAIGKIRDYKKLAGETLEGLLVGEVASPEASKKMTLALSESQALHTFLGN